MMDRIDYLNKGSARKEAVALLRMLESQRALNERKGRRLRWGIDHWPSRSRRWSARRRSSPGRRARSTGAAASARRATPRSRRTPRSLRSPTRRRWRCRHAPRVYIHPREPWGPLRPDDFIGASRLVWNSPRIDDELAGRGSIESERLGADCETAAEGCYEHSGCAADQVTRPTEGPAIRAPGLSSRRGFADRSGRVREAPLVAGQPEHPVYYEVRGSTDSFRITYWFFYGFSQPNLPTASLALASHEGDWESIDVKFAVEGGAYVPRRVIYYAHGQPAILDWAQATVADGTGAEVIGAQATPAHPLVFSAVKSHASYPTEGGQPTATRPGAAAPSGTPGSGRCAP